MQVQNQKHCSEGCLPLMGSKILLRDWKIEDLESLAYWLQPHHKWNETDGPYYPRYTTEEIQQRCQNISQQIETRSFPEIRMNLPIVDLMNEQLLGSVTWYWQSKETQWLSIGITIFNDADWGKGFGFEAIVLWCEYLLKCMPNLERLDLRTWSGNLGMMALAEKIGFKKEAVFRKARIVNGQYYDGIGYGMLRSEFEARYTGEGLRQEIKYYNKMVRDLVPTIILDHGKTPVYETVSIDESISRLIDKIDEETREFADAHHPEELADLLEIIHGIAFHMNLSIEELDSIRMRKKLKNGGFENRIVLKQVKSL